MKELANNYQDKKRLWRKATAILGGVALLTACDQQPQITDGTVYQKEYIKEDWALVGRAWATRQEIGRETIGTPPTYEEKEGSFSKDTVARFFDHSSENWKVYIAQCQTTELPPPKKIEKQCKTNSFNVPQEVYKAL
jgi:hypothetical protein